MIADAELRIPFDNYIKLDNSDITADCAAEIIKIILSFEVIGMSDLRKIPGIGKNIEQDLINIGITSINDLKGRSPEQLYEEDCRFKGYTEDKCQLYVFRLAVYYAENDTHEPEKLKWWYWKNGI